MAGVTKPKSTIPSVHADLSTHSGNLKPIGGSNDDDWNNGIAHAALKTYWFGDQDKAAAQKTGSALVSGLIGISPQDEIEGMLAAQMLACHNASMECFRRAMMPDQTFEGRNQNLNYGNKSSRTFATLLEALNKHRGKGQQKVTVEHVHVHAGGQAIVGTVTRGGGSAATSEDQSHEPKPLPVPDGTALPCEIAQNAQPVPQRRDEG
jgi:hypothetical protein